MLVLRHHCGADVDVDTDGLGRTIDVCRRCGVLPSGWQAVSPPAPQPQTPPPTSVMPIIKKCQRSGREYKATGNSQKFCKTCPACLAAADVPLASTKKPKADEPERKRTPARTGHPSPRSTRSASGIDLSGAIGEIEKQIAALDAQRERLLGAIESLRELEAA